MKPTSFEYVRAQSLAEAVAVLAERGDDAKLLAGGQSLIPAMNMRFAMPETVIDISQLSELAGISVTDDMVRIGATCRHADVLRAPEIAEHAPLIAQAMPHVAHAAIRNRGTFGGSLCHADPAAEIPACALALDARFNIQSSSGQRVVAAKDFFLGTYTTSLGEDEILVSVDVPVATPQTVGYFDEVARRRGDYAMAGIAALARIADGRFEDSRLVFFAVSDVALRAPTAEGLLNGAPVERIDPEAICKAVADDIEPYPDLTTSSAAKCAIMQTLTRRALQAFADRGGAQ